MHGLQLTISYSLPRGHGIPSSYTRLNRQRKAGEINEPLPGIYSIAF